MRCALLIPTVLLVAMGCGPAGTATAQQAEAAAPAADEGSFSQDFVLRTCEEARVALDKGAGIRLQPVPAVLLTAEQALARRKAYAATLTEGSGVTKGMDLMADLVFSSTMLGRYLPDEKVLYILDDVLQRTAPDARRAREVLFAVVAHELVHAHDDQVYGVFPDLNVVLSEVANGDSTQLVPLQTLMSLLEGHATWASELACRQAGIPPLPEPTMDEVRDAEQFDGGGNPLLEGLAAAGNAVARLKMLQYVQGREFCRRAMNFGGEAFMKEVFAHLPLSDDELADFELFKQRWAQAKEAEMEAAEPGTGS